MIEDAVQHWLDGDRRSQVVRDAVRASLRTFANDHPGKALEIRVAPHAAVQCLTGTTHRRGTPPNVLSTDASTWLGLLTGQLSWEEAVGSGALHTSGRLADISALLPARATPAAPGTLPP